ncbi:hypothetical protein BV25DRAFT_353076 [Artomyces pyxidatus]|uniref:Uncharacterized protein n=1 Tax=Artomyces pyxidatus TaxID=48021 RepID=A0ACB8SF80_9AGAM|nr:hypothetical protein BV25DRAFT_353076 [Artomyces pyxidatus]
MVNVWLVIRERRERRDDRLDIVERGLLDLATRHPRFTRRRSDRDVFLPCYVPNCSGTGAFPEYDGGSSCVTMHGVGSHCQRLVAPPGRALWPYLTVRSGRRLIELSRELGYTPIVIDADNHRSQEPCAKHGFFVLDHMADIRELTRDCLFEEEDGFCVVPHPSPMSRKEVSDPRTFFSARDWSAKLDPTSSSYTVRMYARINAIQYLPDIPMLDICELNMSGVYKSRQRRIDG